MPALSKRHWTAANVRVLTEESRHWPRFELLDGELLVTPAPAPRHQGAVRELIRSLAEYCDRERIGSAFTSPADIELLPESIMQPDVFVVPNDSIPADGQMEWSHVRSLLLAVEVLSPSSVRQDRVLKRDFYLANQVDEYWIADMDARVFERWATDRDRPTIVRDVLTWKPRGSSVPFRLDVREFFEERCRLPRYA